MMKNLVIRNLKESEEEKSPHRVLHDVDFACLSNFISYPSPLAHCIPATLAFSLLLRHMKLMPILQPFILIFI